MRVHNEYNQLNKMSKQKQSLYIVFGWLGVIAVAFIFILTFMAIIMTYINFYVQIYQVS